MAVLLLAEIAGGALALDATAKAVTAAKSLGDVTVLVAGPAAAGQAASQIDGVAKVVVADDAAYANGLAEPVADLDATWARLRTKFRGLAEPVVGARRTETMLDFVAGLEGADSLAPLLAATYS